MPGLLAELPDELLARVAAGHRSSSGDWVGTSGRSRTVVYNTAAIDPKTDLPDSILGFTRPALAGQGRVGSLNASFQAFLTAFRLQWGDEAARTWLEGMLDNDVREYATTHDHRDSGGTARGGSRVREPLLPGEIS